ncbi:MAG TPA: MBL fold metallo-hydrolase, partial [Acidobacteriota bacterium]|nr:MBL fold metallo-hydrolase [Acidobacteriota bacterium]
IEHRLMREGRVLHALANGPMTKDELRDRVYADTPGADPRLASRTLAAHLEKLVAEGRVRLAGETVTLVP